MIPIALTSDANFYRGLLMAVASIVRHTRSSPVSFHILDGGLLPHQRKELEEYLTSRRTNHVIRFHKIDASSFEGFHLMYGNALPYARLLLPELLPDLAEVLYGDADIYFGIDLGGLWSIPLEQNGAAVVRDPVVITLGNDCTWLDPASPDFNLPYFNSGVMKINLRHWRERQITGTALAMAGENPTRFQFWDQSLLNLLLKDSVVWVDPRFNHVLYQADPVDHGEDPCEEKNLHYIFKAKPWARYSRRRSFRFWRREYRRLVSVWPAYLFSFNYWAAYIWSDWIVKGPFVRPACRALLATRAHRLIPGLNEAKLRAHLAP